MLLNPHTNTVFQTNLPSDVRREFAVEMNSMLFHSVINGIYADKIKAPIRELSTNARDAHAANGNLDQPFDIYLPSHLEPTFKVRDYGCSLDHDEIMGLYSTMFASSKRDTNEAVGMIGLGSKSPFAYTSVFVVTAWKNGIERRYSAFIGDNDVPQIALISERESAEPTGLEVSFPVQLKDVSSFRQAAQEVLFGFDPYPNVLNETYERVIPEVLYEGGGWKFYGKNAPYGQLRVRQGCVIYPVDGSQLDVDVRGLMDLPMIIDFPIGELSVATSREQLGYDLRTRENLNGRFHRVVAELARAVPDEFSREESYLAACSVYEEKVSSPATRRLYTLLREHLQYKGQPLRDRISITHVRQGYWQIVVYGDDHVFHGQEPTHIQFRAREDARSSFSPRQLLSDTLVILEKPGLRYSPSRMRRLFKEGQGGRYIWVRLEDEALGDEVLKQLGYPKHTWLDSIEPLLSPRTSRGKSAAPAPIPIKYMLTGKESFSRFTTSHVMKTESVIPNDQMVYVQLTDRVTVHDGEQSRHWTSVWTEIAHMKRHDIIPVDLKVYVLTKKQSDLSSTARMIPWSDYARKNLKQKSGVEKMHLCIDTYTVRKIEQFVSLTENMKLPDDILDLIETHKQVRSNVAPNIPPSLTSLLQRYTPDEYRQALDRGSPTVKKWHEITSRYPLLLSAMSSRGTMQHYMELIKP